MGVVQITGTQIGIIGGVLSFILAVVGWYIRYLIVKNDDNNKSNFLTVANGLEKLSGAITSIKETMHGLEVEIKDNYLKTSRFELHEQENKKSIERAHERIDEIIKK